MKLLPLLATLASIVALPEARHLHGKLIHTHVTRIIRRLLEKRFIVIEQSSSGLEH